MLRLNQELLSGAVRNKRQATPFKVIGPIVGVPSATLNRIERCQGKPKVEAFMAVCYWLDRDPTDFVVRPEEPEVKKGRTP